MVDEKASAVWKSNQKSPWAHDPSDKRFQSTNLTVKFKGVEITISDYWIKNHPGGSKVLKLFNGRDATDQMLAMHSDEAVAMIERMAGGDKKKAIREQYPKTDFQKLMEIAHEMNLYEPNLPRELFRAGYSFGFFFVGAAVLLLSQNWAWTGALMMAFGWFQLGWYGHDMSHHTYMPESTSADATRCDWVEWLSGTCRGNGMLWWKLRHNTHHVLTNEVGSDPDIKLLPLFHFFEDFEPSDFQLWQGFYYVPMLSMLHIYWLVETWQVCLRQITSTNKFSRFWAWADIVGSLMHAAFISFLVYTTGRWQHVLVAYMLSGLGTSLVVFATHYGEERLTVEQVDNMDLLEQTCRTSRNFYGFLPWSLDKEIWFHITGGLNVQIEHHLFPRMPRQNLRRMTPYVKAACEKRGICYLETSLYTCTANCCYLLAENVKRNVLRLQKQA